MSEVKLLPLPIPAHPTHAAGPLWSAEQMHDYARANMEPLIAENERLRAEVTEARDGWRMANGAADLAMKHRDAAEAQAERLAEALRELLEIGDRYTGDQDEDAAIYCAVTDNARAALDQEGGNG